MPLLDSGEVADYIPELAKINRSQFGMAVCTLDGKIYEVGQARTAFSLQSISKVFTLTLAMKYEGDALWERLGREPSGTAFNSLVQLEYENGIPRNPFINAGALVLTDVLASKLKSPVQDVLRFVRKLAANETIDFDRAVAESEGDTGFRNAALANFLKSFGNLNNEPDVVLENYYRYCALSMNCVDVARAGLFLANRGRLLQGEEIVSPSQAKYIKSIMLTCGTYDAVGDFAYRVGLPGKSGVGGGILALMPHEFSVCVWSPGLNPQGNSLAGTRALELFTTKTAISIF